MTIRPEHFPQGRPSHRLAIVAQIFAVFFALAAPSALQSADPASIPRKRSAIPIARETTKFLTPVDADGYVDFVAALDDHSRRGITPADNALVAIITAVGLDRSSGGPKDNYYAALGTKPPQADAGDLVGESDFVREASGGDSEISDTLYDQFYAAQTRPWTKREFPLVADWLRRNDTPLTRLGEAVKKTRYYRPLVALKPESKTRNMVDALMSRELGFTRELGKSLIRRAYYRLGERDFDGAWNDSLACRRLGRLLAQGPMLIDALVGMSIETQGRDFEAHLFEAARDDAVRLRRYFDELRTLAPLGPPIEHFDYGERLYYLDVIQQTSRGNYKVLSAVADKPDDAQAARLARTDFADAMRRGNRRFDQIIAALRLTDLAARRAEAERIDADVYKIHKTLAARETEGDNDFDRLHDGELADYVLAYMHAPVRATMNNFDGAQQRHDILLLGAALATYRAEHGRYPDKLDVLSPLYLKTIPTDLFTGRPPIYRRLETGFIVYSVGLNGRDDGGLDNRATKDSDRKADDLVFRIPVERSPSGS